MNIQVQVCALLVISLIMFFFFANKKIGLFTEKIFARALIGSFVCLCLDITSVIVIVYENAVPATVTALICKAYLISLLWMGFSGFDYIMTDLMSETKYYRMVHYFVVMAIIESLIILFSPIYWVHEGRIVYSYGTSPTFTYIFTFLFIITTVIILFVRAKKLNPRRRLAMSLWMSMWFVSAIVQFVYNEFLLVGFAISLGMLTLFFMLENPESLQDRRLGCFNSHALLLFLHQVFERKESYGVLEFTFVNSDRNSNISANMDEALAMLMMFLNKHKNISIYKNVENAILVFSKDIDLVKDISRKFAEHFREISLDKQMVNYPSMNMLVIEDCSVVDNPDDMMKLLSRLRSTMPTYSGLQIGYVDDSDISEYYHYNDLVKEISSALSEDRVEAFYQPIYSIEKGRYVSCEALARIRREDGTLISPGEFIPVAEETGQIVYLGERIFEKVCSLLSTSKEAGKLDYIEVNLSVRQLNETKLVDRFISIMEKYHVDPSHINLEITESAAIKEKERLMENMRRFLDYGVTFSLDDFGKGESNLMYLVEMPVSILKLDMDMTHAYFTEPKAKYILSSTVQMAHRLGLRVVGEGIEKQEELNSMQQEGIDLIQGYYFSKPVESEQFLQMLKNADKK